MKLKRLLFPTLFLVLVGFSSIGFAGNNILTASPPAAARNERFVIAAMRQLVGAQATYQSTTGNGNYATFPQLQQAALIDSALASGYKYNYLFQMMTQDRTPDAPAHFAVVAVPRQYPRDGVRSFYINENGAVRGANRQGAPANQNDPIIVEEYACGSLDECEANAIASLRAIHGAEATYQATSGNNNFGSLCQLGQANLVGEVLAGGEKFGYYFVISQRPRVGNAPATFEAIAVPRRYNETGKRSFYIATDGVMHGADKNGAPATADDPPLPY